MDESHQVHTTNCHAERVYFDKISFKPTNHELLLLEDCTSYFPIDNDDVVRLDQSQIILHQVKCVVNSLVDAVDRQSRNPCEIITLQAKRSCESNNEEHSSKKRVRFKTTNDQQDSPDTMFVSEMFDSATQLNPSARFLYNLGFDLCLQQSLDENTDLTEDQKQLLTKRNAAFYKQKVYLCKYCSFKTDTIYVIERHYRVPHSVLNSNYHNDKYFCTYCPYKTFRLPELRRHYDRKHGCSLITEQPIRRYACSYCCYESDDKTNFVKHSSRCEIEQERVRIANNLLAPPHDLINNYSKSVRTIRPRLLENHLREQPTSSKTPLKTTTLVNHPDDPDDLIIIDSDHESISSTLSTSDDDIIVSRELENNSSRQTADRNSHNSQILKARLKATRTPASKSLQPLTSHSISTSSNRTTTTTTTHSTANVSNFSSLSKLLLLNGTSLSSVAPASVNIHTPTLPSMPPKPTTNGSDVYQLCNICRCYIFKDGYDRHMQEKHAIAMAQSQAPLSSSVTILNNPPITSLTPALMVTQPIAQTPSAIFLISTMDPQSLRLDMIKCPWCDTNFEHIDVMTGHLMRYHRMTLAAAKVVVAEQMKIQGTSSSQLSLMFKKEIEQIQKDFGDQIYWKISQPKVYLHQIETFMCFICQKYVDDIENHLLSIHNVQLMILSSRKQCCLCGIDCLGKTVNLIEHQLRTHAGVCYSSVLKHFIRFEPPPPPPPSSKSITSKPVMASVLSTSTKRNRILSSCTDKKFGCRKCDTSSRLFTFEELVEHLRSIHKLTVQLHRRCILCQQTFPKGNEYNQHCLEHLRSENPSIEVKRYRVQ